ncbi:MULTISPECIES: PhzF family phenazine biosynthesis protein [Streptomyces]|uniref:Phenazine biosynthesis protein PhzF n=1 Tax=Streptomyces spororaveus TaxID=284039 RepID=A0ABQ3T455_9ACTN|nr:MULTISPECIES: PhzF family phenazine biosynthesis protein [Streptomyces]MCX5308305.1 PhzF family phenazine biosynthesis protein [Streptomyces sp. NBC_00160]GHI75130.1 phenazine biosynthesis protein PhzF [Streptomyces spororaveus]
MRYHHVDVFTDRPYGGNSLAVFPEADSLTGAQMRAITQELRHFESVFLVRDDSPGRPRPRRARRARVFDLTGELDFAGHPLIGAAAVLHELHGSADHETWTLRLPDRPVDVTTERRGPGRYASLLDQGAAAFLDRPDPDGLAALFALEPGDLDPSLPAEVISTGLRYLVLPVRGDALARARVAQPLDAPLARLGAEFAYLLDAAAMEGRHWSNDGLLEDVATGSGAGCAAACLRGHGRIGSGERSLLRQGRFTGRPSVMTVSADGHGRDIRSVRVGGGVALVGEGRLRELPPP